MFAGWGLQWVGKRWAGLIIGFAIHNDNYYIFLFFFRINYHQLITKYSICTIKAESIDDFLYF